MDFVHYKEIIEKEKLLGLNACYLFENHDDIGTKIRLLLGITTPPDEIPTMTQMYPVIAISTNSPFVARDDIKNWFYYHDDNFRDHVAVTFKLPFNLEPGQTIIKYLGNTSKESLVTKVNSEIIQGILIPNGIVPIPSEIKDYEISPIRCIS